MSTLGNIYLAMEKDKSELEKVLEIFNLSKQIKYIYDEKNKLVPVDRIEKIGKGVCSTVAGSMVEYFSQAKDRVTWEVYDIPDFHDKKFDSMTYRKLTEYVISHYSPYVFSDKIVESIRKGDPKYDMCTVLKEVA